MVSWSAIPQLINSKVIDFQSCVNVLIIVIKCIRKLCNEQVIKFLLSIVMF